MQTLECPKDKDYIRHQSDTLIPALAHLLNLERWVILNHQHQI